MLSDDIRVTLGGWIDASSNVSNILSPPSYDWIAALRATLELGADAPKKLPTVLRGRALTPRDLREKRIITEQTGLTGDGVDR